MANVLNRERLLLELKNLQSQARATFEEMEKQRALFQKYEGAIDAVNGLLKAFFPEEKANEPSSMGEKPAVA